METPDTDSFWDGLPEIVGRDPEMRHGDPVFKDEHGELTRLAVDDVVGSVEAYIEVSGLSEDQAISATLKDLPYTPGGADAIRQLLSYQGERLKQPQPVG